MSTAYLIVALFTAAYVAFSAYAIFSRRKFVVGPLTQYGVPESWWPWLATAKLAGALGLAVGLVIPAIGYLAATCLILYFIGAAITAARARHYSGITGPLIYLAFVGATLALAAATG